MVYQPIDDESDGFVADEVDPAIAEMPVIQKIFPDWDKSNERNNLQRKEMSGAILIFAARVHQKFPATNETGCRG